jgi:hypothetical protein
MENEYYTAKGFSEREKERKREGESFIRNS